MTPPPAPWAILIPIRTLASDPAEVPSFDVISDSAVYLVRDADEARVDLSAVPMVLDGNREGAVMAAIQARIQPRLTYPVQQRLGASFCAGYHAAPMRQVADALRRCGFRVSILWDAAVAEALEGASLAGGPVLDEEAGKALVDVKEWLADHGAEAIVANLAGPATHEELAEVEAKLGHALPQELRALYGTHDGQVDFERSRIFPNCGFLPLAYTLRETASALELHFGVPRDRVGTTALKVPAHTPQVDAFLPEERTTEWFCFGFEDSFATVVHLKTGRVFQWVRQDGIHLRAESFREYLLGFANDLWNDAYRLVDGALEREGR